MKKFEKTIYEILKYIIMYLYCRDIFEKKMGEFRRGPGKINFCENFEEIKNKYLENFQRNI